MSVNYSTISRDLLNKTINRLAKISFHKHFKYFNIAPGFHYNMCFQHSIIAQHDLTTP